MGSHGSLPRHHKTAVDMIARGDIHAEWYLSQRYGLDNINDALAYHESRKGLKVVVKPGNQK